MILMQPYLSSERYTNLAFPDTLFRIWTPLGNSCLGPLPNDISACGDATNLGLFAGVVFFVLPS